MTHEQAQMMMEWRLQDIVKRAIAIAKGET